MKPAQEIRIGPAVQATEVPVTLAQSVSSMNDGKNAKQFEIELGTQIAAIDGRGS